MRALSGTRETGELAMRQVVELEQKEHFKDRLICLQHGLPAAATCPA
jgi:hypothetical protein